MATYIFVVISLPEAKNALPKECKQLHAVQLVKFEVSKSKIHVLGGCVVLLSLESLEKMTHQNSPQKQSGYCSIRSQGE